ncbi:MAG: LON peptidase substrate-binding domain-containing protein [Planctomycetes bacterium]|nr:LON peptidase substrate-binding domain-containing protein [Planctomycetota bacterium]
MDGGIVPSLSDAVGLFPLPNAVLLPGGTLPLHVFEPRYRQLVHDALDENALMAMAFLLPGYEPYYHTLLAKIHPVVCVGLIRECLQTGDGRYFINLVGICRAKVLDEDRTGDYRRAYLEPIVAPNPSVDQDGEFTAAQLCRQMLNAPVLDGVEAVQKLRKVCGNSMSLEQVVDLMAAALLPAETVEVRQLILSESRVLQRAEILLAELQALAKRLQVQRTQRDDTSHGSMMN